LTAIGCAFGLLACSAAHAQVCADASVREVVDDFQRRQRNVGLAVALFVDGEPAFADTWGWADIDARRRAVLDTRFGIASVTKAYTGLALLQLAAEGQIDLDAEVQDYIPELPRYPDTPVTLRMLAAHVGGIRHWGSERNDALYATRYTNLEEILPLVLDDPYGAIPGREVSYSSYGYNLLGLAMQRATGESYQDLVHRYVIQPLGLKSVDFDAPGFGGDLRAARYSWYDLSDFHELNEPVRVPDRDYTHNMAGGNMVSSIVDLARLGDAVREPGFLAADAYRQLWTRANFPKLNPPMSFGWYVSDDGERLTISGSNAGLQAGLAVWRDSRVVVAAVANTWGIGSRSGELADADRGGFLANLAAACRG
jgi:CubicO group peptidase (beta-lactamase class C family)